MRRKRPTAPGEPTLHTLTIAEGKSEPSLQELRCTKWRPLNSSDKVPCPAGNSSGTYILLGQAGSSHFEYSALSQPQHHSSTLSCLAHARDSGDQGAWPEGAAAPVKL